MSHLFLVRHGQASFLEQNYDKLSAVGETQARLLGEHWARSGARFHRVYSGPRSRQTETARIVGEEYRNAGVPWPQVQVIQEFDEYAGESVLDASLPGLAENNPDIRNLQQAFLRAVVPQEKHKTFQRLFEIVISQWVAGEIMVGNVESWAEFSA